MPKLTLQPQGAAAPLTLDVTWDAEVHGLTAFTLSVEGETLAARGRLDPHGAGTLWIGSRALPFYVGRTDTELHLWLDGEIYQFTLPTPRAGGRWGHRPKDGPAALPASGEIAAPMPGIVLKVLAEPGAAVLAHAPLVVIESMKMELTVTAPADGKVAEVLCEPGARVDRGAVLLRLEGSEDG